MHSYNLYKQYCSSYCILIFYGVKENQNGAFFPRKSQVSNSLKAQLPSKLPLLDFHPRVYHSIRDRMRQKDINWHFNQCN